MKFALILLAAISMVVSACAGTASPSASPSGTPMTLPSATPGPVASASPPASDADAGLALDAATRFERARASGAWPVAWALLSTYSQGLIGTIDDFARIETAYNGSGGARYVIDHPTQNPDLLSAAYLGDVYADVVASADITRAWIVVVEHPDVQAASAATTALVLAPVGSEWSVWIGH
jgi:hypothetical protein